MNRRTAAPLLLAAACASLCLLSGCDNAANEPPPPTGEIQVLTARADTTGRSPVTVPFTLEPYDLRQAAQEELHFDAPHITFIPPVTGPEHQEEASLHFFQDATRGFVDLARDDKRDVLLSYFFGSISFGCMFECTPGDRKVFSGRVYSFTVAGLPTPRARRPRSGSG